jgi:aspartokinase-like uncharacterized kinase
LPAGGGEVSVRRVLKIGGSILVHREAPSLLRERIAADFSDDQVNMIVGGGRMIDALRELDDIHGFDQTEMHWRCIRALRLSFELASEWFPEAIRIQTEAEFQAHRSHQAPGMFLIAVDSFYTPQDADALPIGWQTTSDSLSALLAKKLSIRDLTLIKSCQIAQSLTVAAAASKRIVDEAFVVASEGIDLHLCSWTQEAIANKLSFSASRDQSLE